MLHALQHFGRRWGFDPHASGQLRLWDAFLDPELEQDHFLTGMNAQFVKGCFST
jgi:hypothetical protein